MLLELDDRDLQLVPAQMQDPRVLTAVENLASAHFDGAHLIWASRRMIAALETGELSQRARGALSLVRRGALLPPPGPLSASMKVRFDPVATALVIGAGNRFEVPVHWFTTTASVQPTRLLCEGEDDLTFLVDMAMDWLTYNGWGTEICAFRLLNGGGGNSAGVFERELRAHLPPLLVILDSDVSTKGARTAANVRKVNDREGPSVRHVLVLKGQEIENYVPAGMVRAAYADMPDVMVKINAAAPALGAAGPEDLKKLVADKLFSHVVAWLRERGASRNVRLAAFRFGAATPLDQLIEEIVGWGLAPTPARV